MRRRWILASLLATAMLVTTTACSTPAASPGTSGDEGADSGSTSDQGQATDEQDDPPANDEQEPVEDGQAAFAFLDVELTDALTGETFRISDFRGEPVYVQGFAVW